MTLNQLTIQDFVKELASDSPAPGGGSIAALCGALGAALTAMVTNLTIGKEKYKPTWDELKMVQAKANLLSPQFLELVQRDTDAYNDVVAAFRLPKTTDAERMSRQDAVQAAMKLAAAVPLVTLQAAFNLIKLALTAINRGNPNAVTDAGAAVQMAKASATIAAYNVRINLPGIKDTSFVASTTKEVERILQQIDEIYNDAHAAVNVRLI